MVTPYFKVYLLLTHFDFENIVLSGSTNSFSVSAFLVLVVEVDE
jgi:hypothetical protein